MSRSVAISKRQVDGLSYGLAALLVVGAAAIGATVGIGTANAGCVTASGTASVDCDGIQHGQLSGSTVGAVDGQGEIDGQGVEDYTSPFSADGSGSYVGGQAVEDSDGTQGEYCGAMPGSIPRC